jgi:hypothetical protein
MKKIYMILVALLVSANSFTQTLNFSWAKSAGSNGYDVGKAVATDGKGNVYVTGYFHGKKIGFGKDTLLNKSSKWGDDIFLAKYDSIGTLLWVKSIGGIKSEEGIAISTDSNGNVFITGYFESPKLVFGSITLNNTKGKDIFIAKYDDLGNVIWAKKFGGNGDDNVSSMYTDPNGNSIIIGTYDSPKLEIGKSVLTNNEKETSMYIAKYNSSGEVIWAKSTSNCNANDVTCDLEGNVYVTGSFYIPYLGEEVDTVESVLPVKQSKIAPKPSPSIFGTTVLNSLGGQDIFIVKYDSNGIVIWAKSLGGAGEYDEGVSLITDLKGHIYVTGNYESKNLVLDSLVIKNELGRSHMFIIKYDSEGKILWVKNSQGNGSVRVNTITTDSYGSAYIFGNYSSYGSEYTSFDNTKLTNSESIQKWPSSSNIFIVKYDANGSVSGEKNAGGVFDDEIYSATTDSSNNIIVTGKFVSSIIILGAFSLTNSLVKGNYSDMFIGKINTGGLKSH